MTRIDFHSNVPDKIAYACRLVRKARAAHCKLVVLAEQSDVADLDSALWTFSAADFLPHVMAADTLASVTPVILTADDKMDQPHHQILVNLTSAAPANFSRYERMIEIVTSENADKLAGRERYRFYQEQGYPLTHFVAEKS